MNRFVAYYRVSTDKQGQSGLGLEAQRKLVRGYMAQQEALGMCAFSESTEVESGRRSTRPVLDDALLKCRTQGATLVVAKLDRLARDVRFLSNVLASGVQVVFLDLPHLGSGPVSTFMLQQMAAVAQLESGLISQRTKAALAVLKANGKRLGGDRGVRPSPEARERSARARAAHAASKRDDYKRVIADIRASGDEMSLAQIARALNERGVQTPTAKGAWRPMTVSRALQ